MSKLFKQEHPEAYALMLQAVVAVLKQARVSMDYNGLCRYRADGGAKCAVGHLIPDEKYDPEMDSGNGINAHALQQKWPKVLPRALDSYAAGTQLCYVQQWHDGMRHFSGLAATTWRSRAIDRLPVSIHRSDVLEACKAQGIEVAA